MELKEKVYKGKLAADCQAYLADVFKDIRQEMWQQVVKSPKDALTAHYELTAIERIERRLNADIQTGNQAAKRLMEEGR